MQKYLPYLLSITLIWGCKDDDLEHRTAEQRNAFLQKNEIGIYNGDNPIVLFQSDLHQLAYTSNGKSWRIQTDNQQQYLSCRLNEKCRPRQKPDSNHSYQRYRRYNRRNIYSRRTENNRRKMLAMASGFKYRINNPIQKLTI